MKILFVGLGSIGQRHLRNIKTLYPKTSILAYRKLNRKLTLSNKNKVLRSNLNKKYDIKIFQNYKDALKQKPEAVFICNPTTDHVFYALEAAKCGVNIFIDKPISHNLNNLNKLKKIVKKNKLQLFVGYQLRFSESLNYIKKIIEKKRLGRLCGANIYNGEYLPDYHKYEDYRFTTMAKKKLGGGVINSQIHELDYCLFLFGKPKSLISKCGKFSEFKIDVEDYVNTMIFFKKDNIAVNLTLDFFQRPPIRQMFITGTKKSLNWDYYKNVIKIKDYVANKTFTKKFGRFDRNKMFIKQTKFFFKLLKNKKLKNISDISNAIEAVKLSEKIKKN